VTPEQPLLLTKRDAAHLLSVSLRTIDNLIAAKRLAVRRIGRRSLIPRQSIELLAKRDCPPPAVEAAFVRDTQP
jgi:excisionase family DNA binding protein